MNIQQWIVGEKRASCYLLRDETTGRCALIDPGVMTDALEKAIITAGVDCFDYILLTHCHYDHVGAAWQAQQMTGAPIAIHADDAAGLGVPLVNRTGAHGRTPVVFPSADLTLAEGKRLRVGSISLTVLHTPGHTAGGCCYLTEGRIFTGDTLFCGTCGKTDLPTGDAAQMRRSLGRLAALEGDYVLLTGHGFNSTLARERQWILGRVDATP